jgi:hypothetical protein
MRDLVREVWAQEVDLIQTILTSQRKASSIVVNLQ